MSRNTLYTAALIVFIAVMAVYTFAGHGHRTETQAGLQTTISD